MNEPHPRFHNFNSTRRLWLNAQFFGCAVLLAACGGGGGGTEATQSPTSESPAPAPATGGGTATLSWSAPQTKADGSALSDLAGYRIYYGTSAGSYTDSVTISDPLVTSYTVANLSVGTYYFVLRAYDKSNAESASSAEVSKTIQ